jgi:hypothetical protein
MNFSEFELGYEFDQLDIYHYRHRDPIRI